MDGDVVFCPVDDVDDEGVAVPGLDGRAGVLTVHGDDAAGLAQPLHRRRSHLHAVHACTHAHNFKTAKINR